MNSSEANLRNDLAAAFRWTARLGLHEATANHFSVALDSQGSRFLMNPNMAHFSQIRARDLLLLSSAADAEPTGPHAPDRTAWELHSYLHRNVPRAQCILHTHMPYATTLTTLKDGEIKPLDQNCLRFFGRVAYDDAYDGLALSIDEGERFARAIGDKSVLMLANHGVIVVGESIAKAFDELYYLEKACQVLVLAYSTGKELRLVSDNLAARVAKEWQDYGGFADAHFAELKAILDVEAPEYAQ